MLSRRHFLGALGTVSATLLAARLSRAGDAGTPDAAPTLRVALVCDTHTNLETEGEPSLYRAHFEAIIAQVNAAKVDAVLLGGDLTEGGKPDTIAAFLAQAAQLNAPQLRVAGNHDVGAKRAESIKSNLSQERVLRFEAGMGPSFWQSEIGGARFVGLNASLLGSGLPREIAQWEFLENALAQPGSAPLGTHLLTHYPPFLSAPDEPSDYWNIEPAPRARLLALLAKAKVRGVFSGHLHRPLFNVTDELTLVTAPPVSFGLPRGKQPEGWTLLAISPNDITFETRSINA